MYGWILVMGDRLKIEFRVKIRFLLYTFYVQCIESSMVSFELLDLM